MDNNSKIERPEIISALRFAHDEIVRLRRQIAVLEPKAHAYDTIAQVARLSIQNANIGYGEDPAWRVKQVIDALVAERGEGRDDG